MEWFLICVVLLFCLALLDLSVGVSNDAVNFLNSAIGSRVATRRTILLVASVGILCGALFSSGMMEVARKGIFNPQMFTFAQVMVLFLAVMFADVLLLDLFNTFALPTSTTVSIVFELLGAAVALAIISAGFDGAGPGIGAYINGEQALAIIAGIFLSVGVAFAIGAFVQFVSRALFTFRVSGQRWLIQGWATLAMTALAWFLLIKGLKGATFVPGVVYQWVAETPVLVFGALIGFFFLLNHGLARFGVPILKLVVLFGTFALAMAFASNDLVNFVGVPLAGLAAWRIWQDTGVPAEDLTMEQLAVPVSGDTLWLLAAGAIMVLTLWTSAKARSVTETEVNLGRQDSGAERFGPGPLSRSLVRGSLKVASWMARATPGSVRDGLEARFRAAEPQAVDGPAFDLIRASVNLVTASLLIALATSLKLPLSTTYVSFMVAMGTSLADRAWGRDSAAYRVAGVLSVIGGWFLTAAIAFTTAAIFAVVLHYFQALGLMALSGLVVLALYRTHHLHRSRQSRAGRAAQPPSESLPDDARAGVAAQTRGALSVLRWGLMALAQDDRRALRNAQNELTDLRTHRRERTHVLVAAVDQHHPDDLRRAASMQAAEQDLLECIESLVETIGAFVLNVHRPPGAALSAALEQLMQVAGDADPALRSDSRAVGFSSRDFESPLEVLLSGKHEPPDRSAHNAALLFSIAFGLERLGVILQRAEERLGSESSARVT